MIALYVRRIVLIAAAAGASYELAELFGTLPALVIWGVGMAVACGLGTVLLRTSKISAYRL